MADHRFQPETLAIHAGQIPDAHTGARALPIYQTTSFVFDDADHAASLFNLQTFGNVYLRISNPTVAALEQRVEAVEGGRAALAAATGMAAPMLVVLTLGRADDRAFARLSRRRVPRDLRRLRVHDEGADGDDANPRPNAVADVGVPPDAGNRDAAPADAAAHRVGARCRRASGAPPGRGVGQL